MNKDQATTYTPKANPDDPPVPRPRSGVVSEPHYLGLQGRTAIVQGQVCIVAIILIAQLFIVTDALYELLSGRTGALFGLALVSLIGFAMALLVTFWSRQRIKEP
jgi:hypothetical protein